MTDDETTEQPNEEQQPTTSSRWVVENGYWVEVPVQPTSSESPEESDAPKGES